MDDCIFCKIAAGEMGTEFVLERDDVVAFDDISPQAPVHTLVIPRAHHESIKDDVPRELMAELLDAANEVARIKGIADTGYRLITNCGKDAGQTVMHLHFHVLGNTVMSEGDL